MFYSKMRIINEIPEGVKTIAEVKRETMNELGNNILIERVDFFEGRTSVWQFNGNDVAFLEADKVCTVVGEFEGLSELVLFILAMNVLTVIQTIVFSKKIDDLSAGYALL